MIFGGAFEVLALAVYALFIGLGIVVLWQLTSLIPALTRLAILGHRFLKEHGDAGDRSPERRLLELEDQLRLKNITPEEYEAKRREILNDL